MPEKPIPKSTERPKSAPQPVYIPNRGDIVYIDFEPHVGHEQGYRRPAIVLSPKSYNRLSKLVVVCPITTEPKGYSFEVPLPQGMKTSGVVLSDHVKSFDWKGRKAEFYEKAPSSLLSDVLAKLDALLFLNATE